MPKSAALTEGPIGRQLLLFALPILAGNIAQSLNGSVNAIWVGRYLGEAALTAAANANSIMFFLIGSVFGIGMAATILIGQAMGRGDVLQARRVMGTSATFFLGISVLIAAGGCWLARHLLAAMGTPATSLPLAEAYLRVIFLAMPLLYAFAFLSAALRGTGDSRTPFRFLLLSVALDIGFNPLLLFGLGPFPKLGIAGAAWATLIAQAIALSGLLLYLRHKRHVLWLGRQDAGLFRIDTTILRALVVKGVPMGLQMVLISLAMIVMISMVNGYGTDTSAAYGAAMQLWTYVQMPAMAIGAACSSMAAQNVGAQRWDRVAATVRQGVLFNFLLTGALIAPLILLDRWTLSLFLPPHSAALEIARHLNHIAVWSFLFFGVTFVISGVVRATGAVIPPLLILALSLWGIRLPFAQLLQPQFGADAVWWSFPTSSICAMSLSLAYYRWGNWRKARMLSQPRAEEMAHPAEVPAAPPAAVADVSIAQDPAR
ncbi:MATE family efflux transporter [Xanthomonas translucens]|uniref:MATE family efflux transporter n=2 Tax=Xanthomonas campestris pv. translucens TaxID=343 RepID=UPI0002A7B1C8|nr:MATE family efflux transporter [Xanthomonas translucens]ELQ05311.1 multidrug efflux pump transmembrane protein [Xanthomonas translucens DAR61454]KWV12479.1 MATE family efflux transporter [Xanthomonas translucens]MBC3972512.1 MATE family efflux transporter [Xanthomonas translucens pv. undulosa]MCS3361190.1 MATE family efflux transporter [Xanthomonas translucens pv. translucens]MCS3373948.1 MATE family efflux transporter [Xanthomonas translucens pv. translucens]